MGPRLAVTEGILLDTHALIWLREGTLTAPEQQMNRLRAAAEQQRWYVCSFAMMEIAHAIARGRLALATRPLDWFREALRHPGPALIELSPEVAAATIELPESFHGDPGDRIVAATAVVHGLTLCTHDDALIRIGRTGLYPVIKVNERKSKHAG